MSCRAGSDINGIIYSAQVVKVVTNRQFGIVLDNYSKPGQSVNFTIENLSGSGDLISIRSRGSFSRRFTVVDEIEAKAEQDSAAEEARLTGEIKQIEAELNEKIASASKEDQDDIIRNTILGEKQNIELRLHEANRRLRDVQKGKVREKDRLKIVLQSACTLPGPALILLIAIAVGIRRSVMRRHYVSHASDA